MVAYIGICIGGPYDGKRMGSYDPSQRIAIPHRASNADREPMPLGLNAALDYKIGTYRFEDGAWHWYAELDDV